MTKDQERIGKILLDYKYYPGEDLYCDGQIEEELLTIARDCSEKEYPRIIGERKNWPILYHLSSLRENIVDWVPLTGTEKVLEIGAGCGAITGALARKAGSVTCVDLSKKRSHINAYRHQNLDHVTIHVGNFQDIEPELACDFDVIFLIGVFEYGRGYIGGDNPYEDFLKIICRHKKPDGRVIIAIENKYGMKYFAGCVEDHLGTYFSGIENYKEKFSARTFSKRGLETIFKNCGIEDYSFYYPYPDYKFMTTLYSDRYLPVKGELSNNLRNFDRERLLLFDERDAFDGVIEEGMFPEFSNSFLVVIGETYPVIYSRFSNDRAPEYAIRTDIFEENGTRFVRKYPVTEQAREHIEGIAASCQKLSDKYEGSGITVNRAKLLPQTGRVEEPVVELEYITGVTLSELMDTCVEKEDWKGFRELFDRYMELVNYHAQMPVSDYDLVFSNILVDGDTWSVIDYEWTYDKVIAPKELAFRALYCYVLENDKRNKLNLDSILQELQISKEELADFQKREKQFQHQVTGRRKSMYELYDEMNGGRLVLSELVGKHRERMAKASVQIFEDKGRGFFQEDSYYLKLDDVDRSHMKLTLAADGNIRAIRLDPAEEPCLIQLTRVLWNGHALPLTGKNSVVESNGQTTRTKGEELPCYVFATEDPNLTFHLEGVEILSDNQMELELDFVPLTEQMAPLLANSMKPHLF